MKEDTVQAISSTLRLIADQLAVDAKWSVQQLDNLMKTSLVPWYREQREAESAPGARLIYARRVVQSGVADEHDWSALAHLLAGDEQLEEAAQCMEHATSISPNAEYFRFLVSVNERMGRLDAALSTLKAWASFAPDDPQLKIDEQRVRRGVKGRLRRGGHQSRIRLARSVLSYEGGGLANAVRLVPYLLPFTFARSGQ